VLHLIIFGAELWQSGTMVPGQSDLEHKNAISVWTPLTEGRFMDLISHLGHGYLECNHEQQATDNRKNTIGVQLLGWLLFEPPGRRAKYIKGEYKTQSYIRS